MKKAYLVACIFSEDFGVSFCWQKSYSEMNKDEREVLPLPY